MKKFDAIIIGSGQAGNPLAHKLADKGWKVALLEKEYLGGSCINFGCTPTKTMVASAQLAHYARKAPQLGVNTGDVSIDLSKIIERKNSIVKQWRSGQENQAAKRENITLIYDIASFIGTKVIKVNDEVLTADKIFINTGTSPLILPIEGISTVPYLTNKNIMDLEEIPEHLLVIGGSYIGLEFGQMFLRFGSNVTVIEYSDRITPKEDEDISNSLMESLQKEGMDFFLSSNATSISSDENGSLNLSIRNLKSENIFNINGSHILLGAGRQPNTKELDLETAGINSIKGFIEVDEYLQTNVEGIYALGDVKGGPAFTNISYNDYQIVFNNLFNEEKLSTKNRIVPYALFTDPELGRIGLTENEARNTGYNIKVGSIPMANVARAIEKDETDGLMKIVIDADTDQILGAAILGSNGGEVVQTIMTLMYAKASWKLLKGAVYVHPTITEGFFGLLESVK
jgi:pyruvate/2-oxoglutarate dehydrogenase complex dihydrolipoamide dehydrogenase (E3) component